MTKQPTTPLATSKIETRDVAILFCDLHGIADSMQAVSAIDMILLIKRYFADISKIIAIHNGVINEFIDDTVLAIFGLDSTNQPVEQALKAALAVITHSTQFGAMNSTPFTMPISIDFKPVQIHTIDADPCYEFLVIGDSANMAKHLQTLSQQLSYQIVLSQQAHDELPETITRYFANLGVHQLMGQTTPVTVYGNRQKTAAKPARITSG